MTMSTNKTCPACETDELDESFDDLDAVCNACGFVIHEFDGQYELPDHQQGEDIDENRPEEESWSDAYTVTNSTEQQVAFALETIETVGDELSLSATVRDTAAGIYSDAVVERLTGGRKTEVTVTAALHIAGREHGEPRPLSHLARAVDVERNKIDQAARQLQSELDLEQPLAEPQEYVAYLSRELEYSEDIRQSACDVLEEVSGTSIANGKHPVGLAVAVLYWASERKNSQRELARKAGVTKETIRVHLNELRSAGVIS